MSWQDYVDNQLIASKCVSKAAIAGHDGALWAKSAGFEVIYKFIVTYKQLSFHLLIDPVRMLNFLRKKIQKAGFYCDARQYFDITANPYV